jgi:hypothetical protein
MEMQVSAASALTIVAWLGNPHLTLLHLTPLLWLTLMMTPPLAHTHDDQGEGSGEEDDNE